MGLPTLPTLFEIIATGIVLVICVVTDVRKSVIWPWLCGLLVLVASFEPNKDFGMSILTAALGFVPMFIVAVLGKGGGGGDALLIGALGYTLPFIFSLYMYLAASLYYVFILSVVIIVTKNKDKLLPYAPFVFAGWLTILILYMTGAF